MKARMIVSLLVLVVSIGSAQYLPIDTRDNARTYAVEHSVTATGSIGSFLPDGTSAYGNVSIQTHTAAGISNAIHNLPISIDVENPADPLFAWASIFDDRNHQSLYGYNQFKVVNGKGGYQLPPDYGDFKLILTSTLWVKVPGARYAFVDFLDQSGRSQHEDSLNVDDEEVGFPTGLIGTNAILAVYTSDQNYNNGAWNYWNIGSGTPSTSEHFSTPLSTPVDGIVSITDRDVMVQVPTQNGIGTNQTVEFTSTGKSLIRASFYTSEGKWMQGVNVRMAGTSYPVPYPVTVGNAAVYATVPVQAGVYYITPIWKTGDMSEPADPYYPLSTGGGEKGVVATPTQSAATGSTLAAVPVSAK